MDVRGIRIPGHQELEGVAGTGHQARRLEVTGSPGQEHEVPLRAGKIGGQDRHAQHRQPHRFDDAGRLVPLRAEVVQDHQRLIELRGAGEEDAGVVARDVEHVPAAGDGQLAGLEQILERRVEVLQPELAQTLEGPGRPVLGMAGDHLAERVSGFGEAIDLVEGGAQIPVPLIPRRLDCERLLVEVDRAIELLGVAGLSGFEDQRIELR